MKTPRPYQESGAKYLIEHNRAYLADEPRLGKTGTVAHALRLYHQRLGRWPRVLVICPASAVGTWFTECEDFDVPAPQVLTYNYVSRNAERVRDEVKEAPPDIVVLDEAHYLTHVGSNRTSTILGPGGLVRGRSYVWALSGTPTPNNKPHEWYSIVATLWGRDMVDQLGVRNWTEWEEKFCVWTDVPTSRFRSSTRRHYLPKVRNDSLLRSFIEKHMLRRTWGDAFGQVPVVLWTKLGLGRTGSEFKDEMSPRDQIEIVKALSAGVEPTLSPQAKTQRERVGLRKAEEAAEIISEQLLQDSKLKVFVTAYHISVLDELERRLKVFGLVRVDGSSTQKQRAAALERFQSEPSTTVFLGQIEATATSLPLYIADVAHQVEPSWVPHTNYQSGMRITLPNKERPSTIYQHVLVGTWDERVQATLRAKEEAGRQLYGTGVLD